MTNAYCVTANDHILLLGEGNFSFSKDFVIYNNISIESNLNIKVVSSCKESLTQESSQFKQDTINYLIKEGVTVIGSVDATNLKHHPTVNSQKYSKIIFNFPHVGGKMKIHLNRKLLKDFFSSSCDVLEEGGSVVVALCDGQGGTEADRKRRRWDDSWQVTEMAAQSDFILCDVELFNGACFPNYINVGFRSCDRSFHSEHALVHMFKRRSPPGVLQVDLDQWFNEFKDLRENLMLDFLSRNMVNPFSITDSPSSCVFEKIREQLGDACIVHGSVLECCGSNERADISSSAGLLDASVITPVKDILSKVHVEINCDKKVVKVLNKRDNSLNKGDFSIAPIRCQMLVFTRDSTFRCLNYLKDLFSLFKPHCLLNITSVESGHASRVVFSQKVDENISLMDSFPLQNGIICHLVHLDELAQIFFQLDDWRSLWSGTVQPSLSGHPTFHPSSVSSRTHTFDLGVSVPTLMKKQFHEKFFLVLWLLAGDIIVNTELISTYLPSDRDLICYCYRISYKSFNAPLHRKRIIYIHEKIIAVIVCRVLQVNIT